MNKTLIFLLVTLIQSQSDGVLLSGPNQSNKFGENFKEFQLEDWDNSESPYTADVGQELGEKSHSYRKRSGNDVLMRRSILDKNFMRFGRNPSQNCLHKFCQNLCSDSQYNKMQFLRFDRCLKDNFIRFGRRAQDNFIRFGRVGSVDFLRFAPEKSFGNKKYFQRDDYFSHSGGEGEKTEKSDDFERLQQGLLQDRPAAGNPNGTSFLAMLKQEGREGDAGFEEKQSDFDGSDNIKDRNLDLVIRIKRKSMESINETSQNGTKSPKDQEAVDGSLKDEVKKPEKKLFFAKRSATGFFDRTPDYFLKKISSPQRYHGSRSWEESGNWRNHRLSPPFFPVSSNY